MQLFARVDPPAAPPEPLAVCQPRARSRKSVFVAGVELERALELTVVRTLACEQPTATKRDSLRKCLANSFGLIGEGRQQLSCRVGVSHAYERLDELRRGRVRWRVA
jgi:hypothetical protein